MDSTAFPECDIASADASCSQASTSQPCTNLAGVTTDDTQCFGVGTWWYDVAWLGGVQLRHAPRFGEADCAHERVQWHRHTRARGAGTSDKMVEHLRLA